MSRTILILVEDPGAANFAAGIPEKLAARGISVVVQATGSGAIQLARLGANFVQIALDSEADQLLLHGDYQAVIVGSTENINGGLGCALTATARQRGILTFGVVDGPANSHLRFRSSFGDEGIPEVIFVPNEETKKRFVASGISQDRVHACGHPHLDVVRASKVRLDAMGRAAVRREVFPQLDQLRPLVVFLAERSDGLDPRDFTRNVQYSLTGTGRSEKRTEIILEEVQLAVGSLTPRPLLVVRLHPKNERTEFEQQASAIDAFSDDARVLECVYAADAVVGMTSILLDEAALLGRPTLSVLPRECEKGWLASIEAGITPAVWRREDIAPAISRMLAGPAPADLLSATNFALPGASERVADMIVSVLEKHQ